LFFGPDSRPKKPEKMSVPVCVARSITGYTGSFCPPNLLGSSTWQCLQNKSACVVYFRRTPTRLAVGRKWVEKCFVGSQLSDSRQVRLDKWLTQLLHPEREWLSHFEAGILMIGEIKPTVAIRTELRLIFSESESIECAVIFSTPDLNGYEKLIT
jgi:hypothetical protein